MVAHLLDVMSAFLVACLILAALPGPATALFLQFPPSSGPVLPALLVLALIQLVIDTAWCAGVVLAATRARELLSRMHIRRRIERHGCATDGDGHRTGRRGTMTQCAAASQLRP
jgi:threonine/homoserine/homoserine lactone efflux protein